MSDPMTMITVASASLAGLSIATFAGLRGWQGWLEVRRLELAGSGRARGAQPRRRDDRGRRPQGTRPQARIASPPASIFRLAVIASGARQSSAASDTVWIASSLRSSQ